MQQLAQHVCQHLPLKLLFPGKLPTACSLAMAHPPAALTLIYPSQQHHRAPHNTTTMTQK